jgi:hypothetical protein
MLKGICVKTFCHLSCSHLGCGNSVKAKPHLNVQKTLDSLPDGIRMPNERYMLGICSSIRINNFWKMVHLLGLGPGLNVDETMGGVGGAFAPSHAMLQLGLS